MSIITKFLSLFRKKDEIITNQVESISVSVPLIITKKMRIELRDLGYNFFQINDLSPQEANERILTQKGPTK